MLRLYTDESPGLKVDPVVVLVLSLVFIFSVVALHSTSQRSTHNRTNIFAVCNVLTRGNYSHCQGYATILELKRLRRRVMEGK